MSCFPLTPGNQNLEIGPFDGKLISQELLDNLYFYKNKIDDLEDTKIWDRAKKFSNMWELIHLPNKKNKKNSIAHYEPLSRSFFKLWEMIISFSLLDQSSLENDKCLCLAEGPGGFIECINQFKNKNCSIYGITLKSTHKDIPGWKKAKRFLAENTNVKITYGITETGDLYNVENIKYVLEFMDYKKCKLITADGGFDFSSDFNNQEKMSHRIIFCEIVAMFTCIAEGGHFVCKIFDIHTEFTAKMLSMLTSTFTDVFIYKPFTSRPANSEKYIICKHFKGINQETLNYYYFCVDNWNDDLTINCDISDEFKRTIRTYNDFITKHQTNNIKKTLDIIYNNENPIMLDNMIKDQVKYALDWCQKFNIKVNKDSSFLEIK